MHLNSCERIGLPYMLAVKILHVHFDSHYEPVSADTEKMSAGIYRQRQNCSFSHIFGTFLNMLDSHWINE